MKIALLSNVNMNYVIRALKGKVETFEPEGYGNELGFLQNPDSTYHAFDADITFFVMDLSELVGHSTQPEDVLNKVNYWFSTVENAMQSGKIYYVSDVRAHGYELCVAEDAFLSSRLQNIWQKALEKFLKNHSNARVLPYGALIDRFGNDVAYSEKTWYLGKILLSSQCQNALAQLILERVRIESYVPKKVLVLDLDNTLWGGLAGEADHTPIILADDHKGLAYKNLQRVLLKMNNQGVLLAICSKNNEEDALKILEHHPHMVLSPENFVSMKINWQAKPQNLEEMAKELNLGLDSFVFFDDSGAERELMAAMLPQVTVAQFPDEAEKLAPTMVDIYKTYFAKASLTREDMEKTAQYAANSKREQLKSGAESFEAYLEQLRIVITRENPLKNEERLLQLLNKTNQFNLTTIRHEASDLSNILTDSSKCVYLFRVEDSFGDNGIVAALIVDLQNTPIIREFVMSCRVMGRNVEHAIIDYVENDLIKKGYGSLKGLYQATSKNKPVEHLYTSLGYKKENVASETKETVPLEQFFVDLSKRDKRVFVAEFKENDI